MELTDDEYTNMAIGYLQYMTWDKVYTCWFSKKFPQILIEYFMNDIEHAYNYFLYKRFTYILPHTMFYVVKWVKDTKNIQMSQEQIKQLFFKIFTLVRKTPFDEMKYILGLEHTFK